MKLFTLIKESIYSPEFYRGLSERPLSFSIKYFYMFALTLSIVVTVVFSFTLIPGLSSFLKNAGPAVSAYFPDELAITIRNGEASVNVPEPYVIPMPAGFQNTSDGDRESPKNLLVIDTRNEFSESAFAEYDTMALLMKRSVALSGGEGKVRIEPLRDVPDVTIDKAFVEGLTGTIGRFLQFLAPMLVFGIFVIAIAVFTYHLAYLLIAALLVWLVMKARKASAGYKKAYQVGIHAMTLGLLVNTFFVVVIWPRPSVPFFFTLLLLIVAALNLSPRESAPQTPVPPAA